MTTTSKNQARDLEVDLAICEAAPPGPWIANTDPRFHDNLVWGPKGPGFETVAEATPYLKEKREIAKFIAEAREGWPYAIRRALEAEAEVDRLRAENAMLLEALNQRGCGL